MRALLLLLVLLLLTAVLSMLRALGWMRVQVPARELGKLLGFVMLLMTGALVISFALGAYYHLEQGGDGAFIFGFLFVAGANGGLAMLALPFWLARHRIASDDISLRMRVALAYAVLCLPGMVLSVIAWALAIGPFWWSRWFD